MHSDCREKGSRPAFLVRGRPHLVCDWGIVVHGDSYSLPAITEKLTSVIPSHCNVDVFVRIYPSVDQPESDALYMLVQKKDGEALNYGATIFNVETSFDSFAAYMEKRGYFCD